MNWCQKFTQQVACNAVADYPLGRIGSCLRPGMVRGPGPFILNFFYT